jgi:response regulator RpfG family c-di-GMP phosphodiesterase
MSVDEQDLVPIRRGALLHDIGKLGIPDSILLKPGPLNEEEMEIIRKHPVIAFEMLAPIAYLRPALEIPYCHHEKWDDSGYPRGLKGEQIPLAARIFAVVDVWDALLSDRPYRKSWTEGQARTYLQEQAGKHFDPRVVDAFFSLLSEEKKCEKIIVEGMIGAMESSGRILIADSDESGLSATTDLLQKEGFQCTPVRNGCEAGRELGVNHFDLLITETQMPGNEDLELIRTMNRYAPGMPAIILTAYPSLGSAIASVHLPVTAYLAKPVQPSLLFQHAKTSIANYQAFKRTEAFAGRTFIYAEAIEETIQILSDTRSSFKSRRLSGLRRKLEQLLAGGRTE